MEEMRITPGEPRSCLDGKKLLVTEQWKYAELLYHDKQLEGMHAELSFVVIRSVY